MDVAAVDKKKKVLLAEGLLLPVSMVLVQAFTMGTLILSKLAFNVGMAPFVLLAYRNLIGAITVAPFAFYFERNFTLTMTDECREMMKKVNLKHSNFVWRFDIRIVLAMGLHYYGLRATNAAYTVNFLNVIPVVTFIIAIILRVERLKIGTCPGKMKVIGAAICVGGTMVISMYKGKLLHLWPTHLLKPQLQSVGAASSVPDHHNMLIGTLFLAGSCLSYAFWFIIQVRVSKEFPSKYFSTMLACVSGTVQAVVIGVMLDRRPMAWALNWNLQLLTVVYSGVFNTGITFCLISWAVSRRGPIYPSMFNSLSLIITTVLDSVLLGTDVSVGSLLGALLIIIGLYAFLWGKGKETQEQRKQTREAANGNGSAAGNGLDSVQVGKHEVRIRVEVS
ncbi:unnamed protein product [Triticum turgidum subsp. durum]|uniref:WAT1-related protein n=1 Tax=Triticum turgidum subsp. durum TaxID=4567 RepID=A0A9R1QPZ6_TRITD|nr:unnamed protein product [Triticum turgidum subsp. durum]